MCTALVCTVVTAEVVNTTIVVAEKDGKAEVCVTKDLETAAPVNVVITTSPLSAQG